MTACSDERLADGARRELVEHILPFWRQHTVDLQRGGFVAEMSNDLRVNETAAKGLILNARILWTFAAAYRYTQSDHDARLAHHAYAYLLEHFLDRQHGGFHWLLDPQGQPLDSTKKIYGQAFGVYALAEYYRTFGDSQALMQATDVFRLIEQYSHDDQYGGYAESLSRDWQPIADVRLSEKDLNEKKSMNNHLHVLEAYTNLLRVWADPLLTRRLESLLTLFQTRILNPQGTHLQHFFDEAWQPRSASYTFGHDIEGSWLLCEAAEALGGPDRVAGGARHGAADCPRRAAGRCGCRRGIVLRSAQRPDCGRSQRMVAPGRSRGRLLQRLATQPRRDLPPGGRALLALYPDTDRRPGKRGMVLARLTRRHTRRQAAQSLGLEMPVPQQPLLSGDHPQNIGRNRNRNRNKNQMMPPLCGPLRLCELCD